MIAQMRRIFLFSVSFAVLILLLLLAWTYRYRYDEASQTWSLNELKPIAGNMGQLDNYAPNGQQPLDFYPSATVTSPFCVLELPGCGKVDALHLNYRVAMHDLVAGKANWHKGRIAIQWLAESQNRGSENDPLHDFSGNGKIEIKSRVAAPTDAPAIPRIMIMHMAKSGAFSIEDLKVSAVKERVSWKWCQMILGVTATTWFVLFFRCCCNSSWAVGTFLSLLCMSMIIALILPKDADIKPQLWGVSYQLGSDLNAIHTPNSSERETIPVTPGQGLIAESNNQEPSVPEEIKTNQASQPESNFSSAPYAQGKIKPERSIVVWIKMNLNRWLSWIHLLAFFLPCLVIAILVGVRPASIIGFSFAIASEGSQMLFGDVWDTGDQIDLLLNLMGVALGLFVAMSWQRRNQRIIT